MSGMQVLLGKYCGFCAGVRKAVDKALAVPPQNTFILGELIHNPDVVERIRARGIPTVERVEEVPDGATLLIRSHGVGRSVYEACERRGIRIIDCTCAFVRRSQGIVREESAKGRTIVIIGHPEHPETDRHHRAPRTPRNGGAHGVGRRRGRSVRFFLSRG